MSAQGSHQPVPKAPTYTSYRYLIGGLVLAIHFTIGINFFVVSPLLPLIIDDYGINRATASLLIVLALLIHSCFGLPGGVIVARFGIRRVYTLSWFLMGSLALSAIAPNFAGMLVLRLAYGVGFGLTIPATGPLLMQWFPPREVPIISALFVASVNLGVALSVSTAAPLADAIGWENSLGVFGGIGLIGAFAWIFLGRTRTDMKNFVTISPSEIWSVLRNRNVILLVTSDTMVFMQYTTLTSWLPTFFNESRGMSLNEAGFITSLLPFVGVLAVLFGGLLTLRVRSHRPFFIVPGIMVGLGGFGSFLIENTTGIYVAVIVLSLGSWTFIPSLLAMTLQIPGMTPGKVAVVWGSFVTVSGTGMFLSPIIVGAIRDSYGSFVPGFTIFSIGAWYLVIAGFLLPRSLSQRRS